MACVFPGETRQNSGCLALENAESPSQGGLNPQGEQNGTKTQQKPPPKKNGSGNGIDLDFIFPF